MTNQTRKVTNGQSSAQIGHIADDRWIQQSDALSRQIFHFFHANNESAPLMADHHLVDNLMATIRPF